MARGPCLEQVENLFATLAVEVAYLGECRCPGFANAVLELLFQLFDLRLLLAIESFGDTTGDALAPDRFPSLDAGLHFLASVRLDEVDRKSLHPLRRREREHEEEAEQRRAGNAGDPKNPQSNGGLRR